VLSDLLVAQEGIATREQLLAAGCSALCSETVYELFDVPGAETDVVHVLVPRGDRVLPVPGVRIKVHESRRFPAADAIITRDGLPVTTLARAAVDTAVWSRNVQRAWRMIVAPVQARRLRLPSARLSATEVPSEVGHPGPSPLSGR
jgi:hypothetical protein